MSEVDQEPNSTHEGERNRQSLVPELSMHLRSGTRAGLNRQNGFESRGSIGGEACCPAHLSGGELDWRPREGRLKRF